MQTTFAELLSCQDGGESVEGTHMRGEVATINVRKAGLGFVSRLGSLPRAHEDVGHRQHGGNGEDLVGAPVEAPSAYA